jgi:hypothetical protein
MPSAPVAATPVGKVLAAARVWAVPTLPTALTPVADTATDTDGSAENGTVEKGAIPNMQYYTPFYIKAG